jgi:hypothetical protein
MGERIRQSDPIDYDPSQTYALEFFSGSLLAPAGNAPLDSASAKRRADLQNLAEIRWNDREILRTQAMPHTVVPSEVHAGRTEMKADGVLAGFAGEISDVSRGGYPLSPDFDSSVGSLLMKVELPSATEGIPEPLLVVGHPGEAYLGYVRVLPGKRIRVGLEIWGVGSYESEPVPASSDQPVEIVFDLPALFPPRADARWGAVPIEAQTAAQSRFRIRVDGAVVLDRNLASRIPRLDSLHLGENPIGGSLVSSLFTGKILQRGRLPLSAP